MLPRPQGEPKKKSGHRKVIIWQQKVHSSFPIVMITQFLLKVTFLIIIKVLHKLFFLVCIYRSVSNKWLEHVRVGFLRKDSRTQVILTILLTNPQSKYPMLTCISIVDIHARFISINCLALKVQTLEGKTEHICTKKFSL